MYYIFKLKALKSARFSLCDVLSLMSMIFMLLYSLINNVVFGSIVTFKSN